MEELIKLVADKTGLSEDKAGVAVDVVLGYIKDKLPAPVAGQIEAALDNENTVDTVTDAAKKLGGLLGKKK